MKPQKESAFATPSGLLSGVIIGGFLAVIAGFPIAQAVYEAVVLNERPYVLEFFRHAPTKANLHAWDQATRDRSVFGKNIRPAVLQVRYDWLGDAGAKALRGNGSWLFYRSDADYLLLPSLADERFYKDTFDTLVDGKWVNPRDPLVAIRHFRDQLAARGIDLLLIPISGKPSIYPERLGRFVATPSWATQVFMDSLRVGGFFSVDAHEALVKAKQQNAGPLYLDLDTHWTPRGLEAVAVAVLETLKAHPGWINAPDSLRRVYDVKEEQADRFGDIAELSKLPHRHEIFPLERVVAHQVVDSRTGAIYHDDPASPILWLGDSFSRIYQTDAPRGAGIIAQVARGLGFPLTSIVNDGGASTVVRQQLLRRPELLHGKKVVVWVFVERDLRFGDKGWALLAPHP